MAEGRRYAPVPQLDIAQILVEARRRWLRPSEVCEILRNYQKFHLTPDPPYKPPGGSLFLFDRKALRYFRKDGHQWRKKKDGKTVREAHEKLKSGSVDVLHCYYAHGEDNESFQRRSYWLLDGQLEHIVLVHYREVNEENIHGISHLSNTDRGAQNHTQAAQTSFGGQASCASSPSTVDWNGQTPTSEFEDADSGDGFGASSLAESVSGSGFQITSASAVEATIDIPGCSSSISRSYNMGPLVGAGPNRQCIPFCRDQVASQNFIPNDCHLRNYRDALGAGFLRLPAEQLPAGSFGRASFMTDSSLTSWPQIPNVNQRMSSLDKFSFSLPDCFDVINKKMADPLLDTSGLEKYEVDGRLKVLPNAQFQTQERDDDSLLKEHQKDENAVFLPDDKNTMDEVNPTSQVPQEHYFHPDPQVNCNGWSNVDVSLDQPLKLATDDPHGLICSQSGGLHHNEHEGLKRLDSFGRWMNKEIGKDCEESLMASDSGKLWSALDTENDEKEVSSLSRHMQLDTDSLGPSLSQEQLFSIADFSPDWAYSGIETKVLISGKFLGERKHDSIKWCCMFGEHEVQAEVLSSNVLRCQVPAHAPGRVPFYITCSNRLACSEIREFEYRENISGSGFTLGMRNEPKDEINFQIRFAKMSSLGVDSKMLVCAVENCPNCSIKELLRPMLANDEAEWNKIEEDCKGLAGYRNHRDVLIQKLLKSRLYEWLVCKAHEEGKGPNVLDEDGQGVIHMAAALGYEWAMSPIVAAGVSPNFRDAHGRTGLHWAAYFGRAFANHLNLSNLGSKWILKADPFFGIRLCDDNDEIPKEETVVALVSLGASPSALEDPTSKFPAGQTAADLASSRGHKGIAGYLAEADLTSHLSSLTVKETVIDSVSAELAVGKVVQTVEQQNLSLDSVRGEQLSLRGSLAAVRNSAQAAARIQAAFRVHSFNQRQQMASNDQSTEMTNEAIVFSSRKRSPKISHFNDSLHSAAIKIQQKYRGWKCRKEFIRIRNRIVKIQAHIRGHQVRKQYKKVVWSVGIVEKAILRWRRKGAGLRGFRAEKATGGNHQETGKTDEYDFLRLGRKQKAAGVEKALARVKSMARNPEARDQYMRLVTSQKSKLGGEDRITVQDINSREECQVGKDPLASMID